MLDLTNLSPEQRLRLTESHRLIIETYAAVIRLEAAHSGSAETLKKIETNTGIVAVIFSQLIDATKLAAGKNQVPVYLVVIALILGAAYAISSNLKNTNMDIKIPWVGIEIVSKHTSDNAKE